MIERWIQTLAGFDFEIEHRAGKHHSNADALSRAPHLDPLDPTDDTDEQIMSLEQTSWNAEVIAQEQDQDPDIALVKGWVRLQKKPDKFSINSASRIGKIYAGLFDSLFIDLNDILRYRREKDPLTGRVYTPLLLPKNLWTLAIERAHKAAGHMATEATVTRALTKFYFPGMKGVVDNYIQRCHACQTKVKNTKDQRHTLYSHCEGYPFQKLSLDFVGPLTPARKTRSVYILTVKDTFTRWLEAFPLRRATAAAVVEKLEKEVFPRFGLCDTLHSDRGTQFTGDLLQQVAKTLGVRATTTPSYNPKSNPVERSHRDLGQMLTALIKGEQDRWEEYLPQALFAIRTTTCRSTGLAPFQAMFGRDPAQQLDLIFGSPQNENNYTDYNEYAEQLRNRIEAAHRYARENMAKTIARQRRAYHAERKAFQVGEKVWLFTPRIKPGQSSKMATYWTGPWTISKIVNDLMFQIEPNPTWQRKAAEVVSIDRLKKYYEDEGDTESHMKPPDADADLSMPGDEFAENINEDEDDVDVAEAHRQNINLPAPYQPQLQPHPQPQPQPQQGPIQPVPQEQVQPPIREQPENVQHEHEEDQLVVQDDQQNEAAAYPDIHQSNEEQPAPQNSRKRKCDDPTRRSTPKSITKSKPAPKTTGGATGERKKYSTQKQYVEQLRQEREREQRKTLQQNLERAERSARRLAQAAQSELGQTGAYGQVQGERQAVQPPHREETEEEVNQGVDRRVAEAAEEDPAETVADVEELDSSVYEDADETLVDEDEVD